MFFLQRPAQHHSVITPATADGVIEGLEYVTARTAEGFDCYFSPGVLRVSPDTGRGKKDDFLGSRTLWVDLDATQDRPKTLLIEELRAFSPPPSAIIDSGHGVHAYWFLDHLELNHIAIEYRNLWLANQLGGDHCHSIDHLLRIPDTQNFKEVPSQ